jgi:hypothetical protein
MNATRHPPERPSEADARTLDIHIEELVLRGFEGVAAAPLQRVVETELARRFDCGHQWPPATDKVHGRAVARLAVATDGSSDDVGVALADALYRYLVSGGGR